MVWITAMLQSYEDIILAGMIKKGYTVSAASFNSTVFDHDSNRPSYLIAFRADYLHEEVTAAKVHSDLLVVLREIKVLYYSVCVSALAESCYVGTNIVLPTPPFLLNPSPNSKNYN